MMWLWTLVRGYGPVEVSSDPTTLGKFGFDLGPDSDGSLLDEGVDSGNR